MLNFLYSIITGIIASIVTYTLIYIKTIVKQRKRFSYLQGKYFHYSIANKKINNCITEILYMKGNTLKTYGKGNDGEWEGKITMNEDLPEYGTGIYQYKDKNDCGIHYIQVSLDKKSINVLTTNTSHGKNNTFAYRWIKE